MAYRKVSHLLFAEQHDMGGVPVGQPLPSNGIRQFDPFILLHHHRGYIEPGSNPRTSGIGPHPHRGFSPVTFILKGDVHHRDSRGHSSVVEEGGVQWMNAGRGMIHSERPSAALAEKGGQQEIIQLWINNAARDKMSQPSYQAMHKQDIPVLTTGDGRGEVRLVCGELNGVKGPAGASGLLVARLSLEKGSGYELPADKSFAYCLYIISGKVRIRDYGLAEELHLVLFDETGDHIGIEAKADTELLLLGGRPLREGIEQYGPFVMNTSSEILEAIRDYQMGKMGVLIEDFD